MGTPFDFFSPRSAPSDKSVSAQAQANRRLLADAMRRRGFVPYSKEWWHFTLREGAVPRYVFRFSGPLARNGNPGQRAGVFRAIFRSPSNS